MYSLSHPFRFGMGSAATGLPSRSVPCNRRMAIKSSIVKRSIYLARHKTSVSIEDGFWKALKEIASRRRMTLSQLIGEIDTHRQRPNLSSAIRLFVLDYYQSQVSMHPNDG
jgi:predicted DNA-binding ribbon-helix-helix protein